MAVIWTILALIGLGAGVLSGLFGIGGGLVIVPALLLILKFDAHTAAATSLVALLMPVGAFAVYEYYNAGKITALHISYGLVIGVALFFGAFLGAKLSLNLDQSTLKKAFAIFLVFAAALVWARA